MALSTTLGYRAEIDGLRAVAVLSVLAYHYGLPMRGGFTGVDVFFVISGFLITQIMAAEIAAGTFSVLGFYDRRVRRILPALLTMLAAVLAAGALLLSPGDYAALASSAATAAFGLSNFFFLYHTGYFDQIAELMPLLHTWSLAVEEQFYLVWPLLLFALVAPRSPTRVIVTIAAIAIIGCAGSIVHFQLDPKAAFFLPLPRAWELALGALLAFLPALPRRAGEICTIAGLALIAVGFAVVSSLDFPGPSALYPCLGAALVIWPRVGATVSGRILGLLAPVGLISYSLYLWHWPIWVYFRIYNNNDMPSVAQTIALAIVSIIVATLSYRYVEQPFRRRRWSPPRTVAAGLACAALVFAASIYVERADGMPQRIPAEAQAMRSRDVMWDWPCKDTAIEDVPGVYCVFGAPWQTASRKTMIWGDSHAEHIAPLVDAASSDPERSFLVFAGCAPVLGGGFLITSVGVPEYIERCKRIHSNALKLLKRDAAITQVVMTSNWLDLPVRIGKGDAGNGLEAMRSVLAGIVDAASIPGRRFILIGADPELPARVVECAHHGRSSLLRAPCPSGVAPADAAVIRQKAGPIDAMFSAFADQRPNVSAVFPTRKLCGDDSCTVYLDGEFIYMDIGHFRRNLRLRTKKDLAERIGLTAALAE